jgi:hypothetical protein
MQYGSETIEGGLLCILLIWNREMPSHSGWGKVLLNYDKQSIK